MGLWLKLCPYSFCHFTINLLVLTHLLQHSPLIVFIILFYMPPFILFSTLFLLNVTSSYWYLLKCYFLWGYFLNHYYLGFHKPLSSPKKYLWILVFRKLLNPEWYLKQVLLVRFSFFPQNSPNVKVCFVCVPFDHSHYFPAQKLQRHLNSFLSLWMPVTMPQLERLLLFEYKIQGLSKRVPKNWNLLLCLKHISTWLNMRGLILSP